jgi:hypothetical protein
MLMDSPALPPTRDSPFVSAPWARWLAALADLPPVRRVLEALLADRCRRHLTRLDQTPAARLQLRALLSLVHRARATPFGLAHDFGRIRTVGDFRRLVPLRSPAEMSREYGRPGAAWPVARAGDFVRAQRRAIRTALALALRERPRMRLLDGKLFWLGDDAPGPGLAPARFPMPLRSAVRTGPTGELPSCVVGTAEQIAAFLQRSSAWSAPELAILLRTRPDLVPPNVVGHRALVVEMLFRPEAPVAVADPGLGGLRLLVDHGVYFEFVPAERADDLHPPRLGLDEVRPGVAYEVALSSPAGVWAQKSGLVVCFERLAPPVVRLLPVPCGQPRPPVRSDAPAAAPQAPHRRGAGSPAAPPGMPFHSLWSARADRG